MHRIAALLAAAVLAGCAGRTAPASGPEPLPEVLDTPSERQNSPYTSSDRRPAGTDTLDSPIEAEIAAELETAADSAADEEALEELASAGPATSIAALAAAGAARVSVGPQAQSASLDRLTAFASQLLGPTPT